MRFLQYKILILGIFIVCLFSGNVNSQNINKELERFALRANAGSEIEFVFSATDNKGKEIYNESGSTIIHGNKYKLEIPNELLVVNDGTTRWIYKGQDDEMVIAANNPQDEDILENPFVILKGGNGGVLKNYTVSVINRVAGAGGSDLQGVPDKIILTAKGGAKYTIKITGFKSIANPLGILFELDVKKYPNAIVTDLR